MSNKTREVIWGGRIMGADMRARRPAKTPRRPPMRRIGLRQKRAWSVRMKGYGGPAQPSPLIGDALNAGYRYLEVRCDGCGTHNTVDLTIIRRPKETPIWQLDQRMRCKPYSEQRGYPYKRGHPVRLRPSPVTTKDDGEPWYPGDQRDRN